MYIPGEHFLSAALEQDAKDAKKNGTKPLWDWAFERRVLLATPTNLVAIAKTVASIWRQERLAEAARRNRHYRQGVAFAPCDHDAAHGEGG